MKKREFIRNLGFAALAAPMVASGWEPLPQGQAGDALADDLEAGQDVAEVVSRWTGIPVSKLMEGEVEKLIRLEDHLRAVVSAKPGHLVCVAVPREVLFDPGRAHAERRVQQREAARLKRARQSPASSSSARRYSLAAAS